MSPLSKNNRYVFVNTVKKLVDEWLDKQADSQKA